MSSAFSNPGSATKSYVNNFLIFTWPFSWTTPAALLEICIGIPPSTSAWACFPALVSNNRIFPLTTLLALSYVISSITWDTFCREMSNCFGWSNSPRSLPLLSFSWRPSMWGINSFSSYIRLFLFFLPISENIPSNTYLSVPVPLASSTLVDLSKTNNFASFMRKDYFIILIIYLHQYIEIIILLLKPYHRVSFVHVL